MDIKEHGMLYKSEMVNAILREIDPKLQTRRPITFANSLTGGAVKRKEWHLLDWDGAEPWTVDMTIEYGKSFGILKLPAWRVPFKGGLVTVYPRIWPGHRIWARETFYESSYQYTVGCEGDNFAIGSRGYKNKKHIFYCADGIPPVRGKHDWGDSTSNEGRKFCIDEGQYWWFKKPSLFMPRWASRITLNVTGMRSQRIQEISEHDAKAEGITVLHSRHRTPTPVEYCPDRYVNAFQSLWDSINTGRGFPWAGNHPVWIHDFKRIDKEDADGMDKR